MASLDKPLGDIIEAEKKKRKQKAQLTVKPKTPAKGGKSLPRTTYGQWAAGQRVSLDALQPGDLVFYAGMSHVGLYVGGGSIIHAPNSRSVVRYDSVYWWGPIDGAIRP